VRARHKNPVTSLPQVREGATEHPQHFSKQTPNADCSFPIYCHHTTIREARRRHTELRRPVVRTVNDVHLRQFTMVPKTAPNFGNGSLLVAVTRTLQPNFLQSTITAKKSQKTQSARNGWITMFVAILQHVAVCKEPQPCLPLMRNVASSNSNGRLSI
jgi:hypothetical protein